jgi:hypothetical protein
MNQVTGRGLSATAASLTGKETVLAQTLPEPHARILAQSRSSTTPPAVDDPARRATIRAIRAPPSTTPPASIPPRELM